MLTRLHRYRERDRGIVERRKAKVLKEAGTLACEACGFDFRKVYGPRGDGFIECHHTQPVSALKPGEKTKSVFEKAASGHGQRLTSVAQAAMTMSVSATLVSCS